MKRRKWARPRTILLIIIALITGGFYSGLLGDKFDRAQRRLAGPGAIDCGSFFMSPEMLDKYGASDGANELHARCIIAWQSGKPFYARWDEMHSFSNFPGSRPERISRGIVGTSKGEIYFVYHGGPYYFWPVEVLVPSPLVSGGRISSSTSISVPFD